MYAPRPLSLPVSVCLLGAALSLGACSTPEPPGLELRVDATSAGDVSWLVVFLRAGDGADRAVGARAVDLAAADLDAATGAFSIGVETPERLGGEVTLHVVGCNGPAQCLSDPSRVPDCQCPLVAMGTARVVVGGGAAAVELTPVAPGCDLDGDLFPDCALDGCCAGWPPGLAEAVTDCHDAPPLDCGGCDPREAHPFRPAELTADEALEPLAVERHRRWCGDGLDNDCRDGVDVACADAVDADGDGFVDGVDCDDGDPTINPDALDVCGDGIDQDCVGGDRACDFDRDGSPVGIDCDDGDPERAPGRVEICGDGVDQDCDGQDPPCVPDDIDGDGVPCPADMAAEFGRCVGPGLDCNDLDSGAAPGLTERCGDGIDQDCDGVDPPCPEDDADGDGQRDGRAGGIDCDDGDPAVYPGAPERCGDGIDQDCDGADLPCAMAQDGDGDGWPAAADCDDRDADVAPGGDEVCNGTDDDCDGRVDEGNPRRSVAGGRQMPETCGAQCPDPAVPCACSVAPYACVVDVMVGAAEVRCLGVTGDGRVDVCNGIDDDCDGRADEGLVRACYDGPDGTDGVGICRGGEQTCVSPLGSGAPRWSTCNGQVMPGDEVCDGRDEDCDGRFDEAEQGGPLNRTCYPFEGQPGVGICLAGRQTCESGRWAACVGARGPAVEMCNGADDDCDGTIDGMREPCYEGPPGTEGVGPCRGGIRRCNNGSWTRCNNQLLPDVDDRSCDDVDQDCDGDEDEDYPRGGCGSDVGECSGGRARCDRGEEVCDGERGPESEECNGRDDDCDGVVDNDAPCPGMEVCREGECTDPE